MFGERIAELRKNKRISQEELADILCTSRQAVSKWERGESDPDIYRLKDLASYFGVSIDYLLGYDIESSSVNSFMERLEKCLENRTLDVSIDEIKSIVARNSNNFDLYVGILKYLAECFTFTRDTSIGELVVEYAKKAALVYQTNNKFGASINDIYKTIIDGYLILDRYDLVKEFIEEHKIQDVKYEQALCEYQLGNNEKASNLNSEIFLSSVIDIVNSNTLQAQVLLKAGKVEEAYNLAKWCISFIKSLENKENLFLEVIVYLSIVSAISEKYLGMDYSKNIKFAKDNYKKIESIHYDSEDIKFYYKEKISFTMMDEGIKTSAYKAIEYLKGSEIYNDAIAIYQEIFGGNEI